MLIKEGAHILTLGVEKSEWTLLNRIATGSCTTAWTLHGVVYSFPVHACLNGCMHVWNLINRIIFQVPSSHYILKLYWFFQVQDDDHTLSPPAALLLCCCSLQHRAHASKHCVLCSWWHGIWWPVFIWPSNSGMGPHRPDGSPRNETDSSLQFCLLLHSQ